MPISLILTPFDYFQIHLSFAVTPNLILEPCLINFSIDLLLKQMHYVEEVEGHLRSIALIKLKAN